MDRLNLLTMSDYGIVPNGIRSFKVDSVIHGRGPDRLKYLDLEGKTSLPMQRHWKLNGQSVLCITSAFNHLERLNDAKDALRIFTDEPLNAIGIIGLKPSSDTKPASKPLLIIEEETAPKAPTKEKEKTAPSVRETLPHRSAGYGQAHQERQLTVPDRSRPTSPNVDVNSNISKNLNGAKERRRWESGKGDLGYVSSEERYGAKSPLTERPPHRTQALSPRIESSHRKHDSEYNPYSFYNRADRSYDEGLTISVKETTRQSPYRLATDTSSRQFDISPKSLPSDYSSASEQTSPYTNRNIDDVVVTTYHMTKTTRREQQPPHRTAIY
uniref:Velvet domain-containing protein n=1 Tax=Syphacia muris TaxID=451379 RepID=A0A0N5B0J0_9BILA